MMTSKRVLAALALAALPAASAFAQSAQQNINLTATVPKFCKYDAVPTFNNLDNVTIGAVSTSSSVVTISTATNSTGLMNPAGFTFSIPATCNFPSRVTMTSLRGALKDSSPEPIVSGTFLSQINYNVTATWNGSGVASLSTDGTANKTSSPRLAPQAHSGPLAATFNLVDVTTAPLAAGDYADTLRITLEPQ